MRPDIIKSCNLDSKQKIGISTKNVKDIQIIFNDWLLSFLRISCFTDLFSYDIRDDQSSSTIGNYINFTEMTTPSLSSTVINDLTDLVEGANKEKNTDMTFLDMMRHFMMVYGNIGVEFKLKYFYADYLQQFMELKDVKDQPKKVELIRITFLKLCHQFFILGLISRKRPKGDMFIKNYYKIANN